MFAQLPSSASRLCTRCCTARAFPQLARRHLSAPTTSADPSASSSSSKDPDHPYLYYHTLSTPPPGRIALSFLPRPPKGTKSRTVLGYLPFGAAGLTDLEENRDFLDVFHGSIKDALEKGKGEAAGFEAAGRPGDGYIHITDERALPPAGRIGETEDLIGSVFVQDGKIIASTYEPLPTYRLITANGPVILPKGLDTHLIEELERIDREDRRKA